jgi:molybdopterin-guanine dinucleotide biosynthesis protein A
MVDATCKSPSRRHSVVGERTRSSPAIGGWGVAGLLLTGGSSRRMGTDKALLVVGGERLASRLARILGFVAGPIVEVGPGWTGLDAVREDPPGSGPLAAVAVGRARLRQLGHDGAALVIACDLPLLDAPVLTLLATWPGDASVLPVVEGRVQPLCARWSARDLDAAGALVEAGERSLRLLPERSEAVLIDRSAWSEVANERSFADVDTPEELAALGITTEAARPITPPGKIFRA